MFIPTCDLFSVGRKEEQIKDLQLEIDQENRMAENLVQGMVGAAKYFFQLAYGSTEYCPSQLMAKYFKMANSLVKGFLLYVCMHMSQPSPTGWKFIKFKRISNILSSYTQYGVSQ